MASLNSFLYVYQRVNPHEIPISYPFLLSSQKALRNAPSHPTIPPSSPSSAAGPVNSGPSGAGFAGGAASGAVPRKTWRNASQNSWDQMVSEANEK